MEELDSDNLNKIYYYVKAKIAYDDYIIQEMDYEDNGYVKPIFYHYLQIMDSNPNKMELFWSFLRYYINKCNFLNNTEHKYIIYNEIIEILLTQFDLSPNKLTLYLVLINKYIFDNNDLNIEIFYIEIEKIILSCKNYWENVDLLLIIIKKLIDLRIINKHVIQRSLYMYYPHLLYLKSEGGYTDIFKWCNMKDWDEYTKYIFNIENIITEFHFYFNDLRYIWISLVVRSRPIVFKT